MKVWPFGVALRGEASNRHMLRWLKTVVVSDVEKAHERRQVGIGKASASESLRTCRKRIRRHRNWGVDMAPGQVWRIPVYWPGGARHGGDASPICGIHAERGKAGSDSSTCGWREGVSRAAETARDRVPMQDPPADRPVVVRKLL
jgi:hypothetical protein